MYGGLIPAGLTVIFIPTLLLSCATGSVQLTKAVAFAFMFARISDGQRKNSGGETSEEIY